MKSGSRKPLGQLLKEIELISEGQIQEALSIQRDKGGAIGQILVELGYVTQDDILFALGAQAGMVVVNLDDEEIDAKVIEKITASTASVYRIVPVSLRDGVLTVAMADPLNVNILDDIRFMVQNDPTVKEVEGAVSNEEQISRAIDKYYADADSMSDIYREMQESGELMELLDDDGKVDLENAEALSMAAPVVKLLNLILLQAIKDKASDVHLEPFEKDFKVRYRVDGTLLEMMPPPQHLALALISRIKVMSNLNIAETRLPQDGRIELSIGGKPVDLRVSTLPTMFGESCVMRILDRTVVNLDMESIGLRENEMRLMRKFISMPNGIVLVTGPTGSGKTTTLYSCLAAANEIDVKIITCEDPVEYDLAGIVQCQMRPEIGYTYSSALRAILRQDPDKILIGEIRDLETASIAIEAALTGHVVFSTLHTNDSPSVIARLLDIGVEPFLVAATLEAALAQRLVRRICVECREDYEPALEEIMELGLEPDAIAGKKFAYGKGCTKCNNTGYRGRCAIYEIMEGTNAIKELVLDQASTQRVREQAREDGMRTLRESGLLAIFDRITTIEEVVRETLMSG